MYFAWTTRKHMVLEVQRSSDERNGSQTEPFHSAQDDRKRDGVLLASCLRKLLNPLAHAENVLWQRQVAAVFKNRNQFVELGAGM